MSKYFKNPYFLTLLIPIIFLFFLNLTGFCFSSFGWKADEFYIHQAIKNRISRSPLSEQYTTVSAFMEATPDCCEVYRYHPRNPNLFLFAMLGGYKVVVDVKYLNTEHAQKQGNGCGPDVETYYVAEIVVQKCGRPSFDKGITNCVN